MLASRAKRSAAAVLTAALSFPSIAICQPQPPEGQGIRTGSAVLQGGTMRVEVGTNDTVVSVSAGATGDTVYHSVPPGKVVDIPVPPVAPGTILQITVGTGKRRRFILVEVISV
ncbi:MAG: hypothetical protein AB8H80_18475 [Planctomycetota bacterium]